MIKFPGFSMFFSKFLKFQVFPGKVATLLISKIRVLNTAEKTTTPISLELFSLDHGQVRRRDFPFLGTTLADQPIGIFRFVHFNHLISEQT